MNDRGLDMADTYTAYAETIEGKRYEWRGLRLTQAQWRHNFLRRGMLWRGEQLRITGFHMEGNSNG